MFASKSTDLKNSGDTNHGNLSVGFVKKLAWTCFLQARAFCQVTQWHLLHNLAFSGISSDAPNSPGQRLANSCASLAPSREVTCSIWPKNM